MSSSTTLSAFSITTLPDRNFIAGTYQEIDFEVYDEGGSPVDISGFTYAWYMSPYGEPSITTLSKTGAYISTTNKNKFRIVLYSTDTLSLSGKFVQQPVITTSPGNDHRPAQGYIIITAALGV